MSKEAKKSIYESIKNRLENTGSGAGKIFFTKAGDKKKIRFLNDFEQAVAIDFHGNKFGAENRFSHPCLQYYGKSCPNCKNKEASHDTLYAFSIYDYKAGDVKLFIYKANKCSPLASMMALFEEYGTIVDRDYTIKQTGEANTRTFDFLGGDKKKFRIEDAEPLTEKEIFEIIKNDKYMFNLGEGVEVEEDDEEEEEAPKAKKVSAKPQQKAKKVVEEEEDDFEEVVVKGKKTVKPVTKKKKVVVEEDYDDFDDEEDYDDEDED